MKNLLNQLYEGRTLSFTEAKDVLKEMALGRYNPSEMASFLTVFRMRNITVEELQGFRWALMNLALPIQLDQEELIDLCGTGGDGKDTFNISTLASFVVAGAGYKVAKHGNYGVSSGCGSSNVMEYLGYTFTNKESQLKEELDSAGICFLHAPLFNPGMKVIAPIRKELGVKTFFNMLGPMINPAKPSHQIAGVYDLELARLYAYLYQDTVTNYSIIHSLDGYDEVSLTSDVKMYSKKGESLIKIQDLGFKKINPSEIVGGEDIASSAKIFMQVLEGEATANQTNVVLCNAALAIQTLRPYKSFADCFYEAEEALLRGAALESFKKLVA